MNTLSNIRVTFHGFRNDKIKSFIEKSGGLVSISLTEETDCLIVPNLDDQQDTAKRNKAKILDIPILTMNQFLESLSNG